MLSNRPAPADEPGTGGRYGMRDEPLVVRPEIPWKRYLAFGVLMVCGLSVVEIAMSILYRRDPIGVAAVIGVGVFVGAILLVGAINLLMVGRLSELLIDGDTLVLVTRFGRRRSFPRAVLKQIVRGTFDVSLRSSYTFSYFVVVAPDRRTLFKLSAKWWPEEGIQAIGRALQLPVTSSFLDVVDGPTFRREYPGSIPWVIAHPRLAAAITGILFLPVLFAGWALVALAASLVRAS